MKDFDPGRRARLDSVDFADFWTLPDLEIARLARSADRAESVKNMDFLKK